MYYLDTLKRAQMCIACVDKMLLLKAKEKKAKQYRVLCTCIGVLREHASSSCSSSFSSEPSRINLVEEERSFIWANLTDRKSVV